MMASHIKVDVVLDVSGTLRFVPVLDLVRFFACGSITFELCNSGGLFTRALTEMLLKRVII
jgi:hypothetical protein